MRETYVTEIIPQHRPTVSRHLEDLNQPQCEAVTTIDGPLLVLAGAGTGKTRVLISRITEILTQDKAWPSQILAVTFTNKAATEMRARTEDLFGQSMQGFWIGTFHGICARMLRQNAELVGLSSQYTILNSDDQIRTMRQILKEEELDDRKENAKVILGIISSWKDRALFPHKLSDIDCKYKHASVARRLYQIYEERLKNLDAVDFSNLLLHMIQIFMEHNDILQCFQDQFHYILVDEYQDTNIAQYLWLRMLSQTRKNICCVGDDDQSIYGWRGAEVGNILRFEHDFPGSKVVKLEQNYRSTSHILGAASGLIYHNENRHGKTLWTAKPAGEKIMVKNTWDNRGEARWAAEEIEALQRSKNRLSDITLLVRMGFQTREFEECFMSMDIPYQIVGSMRFYERQEIRDAVSYIRLSINHNDSLAFERIANTPRRGVGPGCMRLIHAHARAHEISLLVAAEQLLDTNVIKGKAQYSLRTLIAHIKQWGLSKEMIPPAELAKSIFEETGYIAMWKQDQSADSQGRIENLKELVSAIAQYESLEEFIEHISLMIENARQKNENVVTVMTMHAAKGLEFDYVFLCGWSEGLFPANRSYEDGSIEEERRLAYVALTRAKKRAYISFATNRHYFGQWQNSPPSRFIDEIPQEHITWLSEENQRHYRNTPQLKMGAQSVSELKEGFYLGERIFHQKFGYGAIKSVDTEAALIDFDHAGQKRVMQKFLERI